MNRVAPDLDSTQYQKSQNETGDRLARTQKIYVNEKNKLFKNVRNTSTYGATDKFGHNFPWVKSDKKWRQTIRTGKIVLDATSNVKLVTSDIEQFSLPCLIVVLARAHGFYVPSYMIS